MQLAKRVLMDDEREALHEQMAVIYPRSLAEVEDYVLGDIFKRQLPSQYQVNRR